MKKKWAVGVLIALAIFILADVLAVTGMTSLYPSRTITCEQLLDPEYSTIYGLKQETSGMLLAEEDDPWIVFDWVRAPLCVRCRFIQMVRMVQPGLPYICCLNGKRFIHRSVRSRLM